MAEALIPHTPAPGNRPPTHNRVTPPVDHEINFDPRLSNSENIRRSAGPGRQDLEGLTVEDDQTRYIVVTSGLDSSIDRMTDKKVGLPRPMWTDPTWKGGRFTFARPTLKTQTKKVGLPRFTKRGGIRGFERREEPLPGRQVDTPTVAVMAYDVKTGIPGKLTKHSLDDFYGLVDGLGRDRAGRVKSQVTGNWELRPDPSNPGTPRVTPLAVNWRNSSGPVLNRGNEPLHAFTELRKQLERHNVGTWAGLTLQVGDTTRQIVFDDSVRQPASRGRSQKWARNFVIKTTRRGEVSLDTMPATRFAHWLQSANVASAHMVSGVHTVAEALEQQHRDHALRDYLGWMAALGDSQIGRAHGSERAMEDYIAKQTEHGPEAIVDAADRTALWLLDYADVLEDPRAKLDQATSIVYSAIGQQRLETLKLTIEDRGVLAVYDTAIRLRSEYLESMKKLHHPVPRGEQSISRVIEVLADRLPAYPELLDDSEAGRIAQEATVDILVGRRAAQPVTDDDPSLYRRSLIQLERGLRPTAKLNAQGQPIHKAEQRLRINDSYFSEQDSPVQTKLDSGVSRQRVLLRTQAKATAQEVLELLNHGQAISDNLHQRLGRDLRALTGN